MSTTNPVNSTSAASYQFTDKDKECSICYSTIDKIASLKPCNHLFGKGCIRSWVQAQPIEPTCPLCRLPIEKIETAKLSDKEAALQQACDATPGDKCPPEMVVEASRGESKWMNALKIVAATAMIVGVAVLSVVLEHAQQNRGFEADFSAFGV